MVDPYWIMDATANTHRVWYSIVYGYNDLAARFRQYLIYDELSLALIVICILLNTSSSSVPLSLVTFHECLREWEWGCL